MESWDLSPIREVKTLLRELGRMFVANSLSVLMCRWIDAGVCYPSEE